MNYEEAIYEFDENIYITTPLFKMGLEKQLKMSSYGIYKNRDFASRSIEINLKRYINYIPLLQKVILCGIYYLIGMCYFDQIIDDKRD